ncbi:hypothetical protein D9M68_922080 [compost metagenome]
MPFDLAGQRDPTLLDLDLNRIVWNRRVPVDRINGSLGDLVVGRLVGAKGPNLDFLRDSLHAFYPARDILDRDLLGKGRHMSG